ncbi:hypothetical protein ANRL3_01866 [Anaerolineae bacterium]|nr:hypothetical protein ANRL3_01866 [Anaerolineae bacterium]
MNEILQNLLQALHHIAEIADAGQGEWAGINKLYSPPDTHALKDIEEIANQATTDYAVYVASRITIRNDLYPVEPPV